MITSNFSAFLLLAVIEPVNTKLWFSRKMIKHRSDLAFYFQSRPPLEKSQSMGCTFPTSPKRAAPAPPLSGGTHYLESYR